MSTEILSRELAPKTVGELAHALENEFPTSMVDGIRIHAIGNSRLRIDTPIKRLGHYHFEATPLRCSWTTPKVRIAVQLFHLSIEQRAEDDTFSVEFKQAPISASVALDLAQHATSKVREIFLARGLKALGALNLLDESTLVEATKASSDYSVLVSALTTEEALAPIRSLDPLAGARLRGFDAKRRLLEEEGGCVSSSDAAEIIKVTRQAVDKRRSEGKLLALELGKKGYHYPVWQFELRGLERVLAVLPGLDSWQKLSFFLNPNDLLDDKSPLEALRDETMPLEAVERAAQSYGEHGG